MVDLIRKKQAYGILTTAEINYVIQGFTEGTIPDYQVSALAMAIYFAGMNRQESTDLTMAMVNSGRVLDWTSISGVKVDKHSTGGVGDKTSLILAPLVAALEIPMIKMSGRGLGHTGGTIDKLEAFPGFKVELDLTKLPEQIQSCSMALLGQSEDLTPADKKLYALRDVTATVMSIPLIASSIMSKKIAAGSDVIILDVKVGSGAFMKTNEEALELAELMVYIGNQAGKKTFAIVSDMSQPLGYAVGNALEVKEAIACLIGKGPQDITELAYILGEKLVVAAGKAKTEKEARAKLEQVISDGTALQKFADFVRFQGGDNQAVFAPEEFVMASLTTVVTADMAGNIGAIETEKIGHAAMLLGAGRAVKDASIDLAVGLIMHKKIGEDIKVGDKLVTIYHNKKDITEIIALIKESISICQEKTAAPQLVYKVIG